MLRYKREGDIVEITEIIMSFTEDKKSYWYHDLKNWRVSSTGKKNSPIDKDMTPSEIEYFKKYHLPKI